MTMIEKFLFKLDGIIMSPFPRLTFPLLEIWYDYLITIKEM